MIVNKKQQLNVKIQATIKRRNIAVLISTHSALPLMPEAGAFMGPERDLFVIAEFSNTGLLFLQKSFA